MKECRYLLIVIIFNLIGNNVQAEPLYNKASPDRKRIKIERIESKNLEKLLFLDIVKGLNYHGFYHSKNYKNQSIKDGPYSFSFKEIYKENDLVSKNLISYTGYFSKNKLSGTQIFNYFQDDGVDFFAEYTIKLEFDSKSNECLKGDFEGIIGYEMKKSKFHFKSPKPCTFLQIKTLAEDKIIKNPNTKR